MEVKNRMINNKNTKQPYDMVTGMNMNNENTIVTMKIQL